MWLLLFWLLNQAERHKGVKVKRQGGQKRKTKQSQKEERDTKIKTQRVKSPHLAPAESKLGAARVERRAGWGEINFPRSIRSGSTASWKLAFLWFETSVKVWRGGGQRQKGWFRSCLSTFIWKRTQPGADIMPCINWCSSFTPPPSSTASSLSIASNFSGKASHFLLIVARCIVGSCRINYLVRCLRQGVGWQGAVQEEGGGEGGGGEGVGGEGRSSSGPEHRMSISNSVCKTTIN